MTEPTRKARYAVRRLKSDRFVEYSWHRTLDSATSRAKYGISDQEHRDVWDRKAARSVVVFFPGDATPGARGFGEAVTA